MRLCEPLGDGITIAHTPHMADSLEDLRGQVTATIEHATDLLASLKSLDEALETLKPELARLTNDERERYVARLCGYDEALPERLRDLVESLADLLAGLTTTDGGHGWLQQHTARMQSDQIVETP
jgi:predicted nuclease with TOPRIM domain